MRSLEEIFTTGLSNEDENEILNLRREARDLVTAAHVADDAIVAAMGDRALDLPRRGGSWGGGDTPAAPLTALLRRKAGELFAKADEAEFAGWLSATGPGQVACLALLDEAGVGGTADSTGAGTDTLLPLPGKQQMARHRQLKRLCFVADKWVTHAKEAGEDMWHWAAVASWSLTRQMQGSPDTVRACVELTEVREISGLCPLDFSLEGLERWIASAIRQDLASAAGCSDPIHAVESIMKRWASHLVLLEAAPTEEDAV